MKLHLPIALLAAVVSAMSFAQANNNTLATYEYNVSGESGYFTQDTSIHFTGDWTNVNFEDKVGMPTGDFGYEKNSSAVGGLLPVNGTGTANNVNVKVGSDDCATNIGTVIGVGPAGYAAIGNKVITVTGSSDVNAVNYTYVGDIIGANNISAASANGYVISGTYEVTGVCDSVIKFAKKTDTDKNITINVEGGSVGQIRGGGSGHSGKIDTAIAQAWNYYTSVHNNKDYASEEERQAAIRKDVEAFVADGPWMRNEQINITVGGDSKVGYKADGVTDYEIGGEAAIYGAGGTSHSVNNDVNITVTGNAEVKGNVLGGAVANTYNISGYESTAVNSSVNNTHITITGNSKVDGNVYGGGWSKKTTSTAIVKGNTEVVLEGGTVTGNVYGAGHGDLVEGNTKVVIKGNGTSVGGTIYGGGEADSVVKGNRILAFDSYTGAMYWDKYQDFNALEFTGTTADMSGASNDFTAFVKLDNSTVTDSNADRQIGKLTLANSSTYENSGKVTVDRIVAANSAIIHEGAPTEITKSDSVVVNKGEMTIGDIWNTATANNANSQGYSKLTLENSGADATLIIKGSTRNLSGAIDSNNSINLHQTGGTVELANESSVSFNLVGEGNTGKLVHSGDGTATISGGASANDWAVLDSSYVVEQTGTGTLKLDGNFRSTENKKLDVAIKQTGAGNIELDATFYASSSAGSTFAVEQSGGGKVTVEEDGLFSKVDVSNMSTFENMASIDVVEVAVNGATLSTSGALHFGVAGTLALTDATLAVNTNSFTSSSAAILMYVGSQITSLDCDAYNIVFGQDTEGLDAMLAGEKLGQTFSVSLITGFDDAAALLAEDLCAAFDKDMLTLQAVDAKGQLIDLLVHDAELSFNGGAIVLSGTASVPEPTTATLSLLALAALAARRRRK